MNVITIESETFQELVKQINSLGNKIEEMGKIQPLSEVWLDNQGVIELLKISKRTLQAYRDDKKIPFSRIGNKMYYRASDIEAYLNQNYTGDPKKKGTGT